ncbi:MAG: carbon-nitrogen hydrolase family protein [Pseudomonadota bacterium]
MILAAAQLQSRSCAIDANITRHLELVELAARADARLVSFAELSITGYEPRHAQALAFDLDDHRLSVLGACSATHDIAIAVGLPVIAHLRPRIAQLFFMPDGSRHCYFKQLLHADELPWFSRGEASMALSLDGHVIVPAICYESVQTECAEAARQLGADVYLASVAKSAQGIEHGAACYPELARRIGGFVLLCNTIGLQDDTLHAGCSSAWDTTGHQLGCLPADAEGLLLLNTATQKVATHLLSDASQSDCNASTGSSLAADSAG